MPFRWCQFELGWKTYMNHIEPYMMQNMYYMSQLHFISYVAKSTISASRQLPNLFDKYFSPKAKCFNPFDVAYYLDQERFLNLSLPKFCKTTEIIIHNNKSETINIHFQVSFCLNVITSQIGIYVKILKES